MAGAQKGKSKPRYRPDNRYAFNTPQFVADVKQALREQGYHSISKFMRDLGMHSTTLFVMEGVEHPGAHLVLPIAVELGLDPRDYLIDTYDKDAQLVKNLEKQTQSTTGHHAVLIVNGELRNDWGTP